MRYLLIILLLSSCYNARKAGQQATRAMETYPGQTASIFRDKWPCNYDTVTIRHTDTLENIVQVSCDTLLLHDTIETSYVKLLPGQTVKVPSRTITIRDTLKVGVRDSSEVVEIRGALEVKEREVATMQKEAAIQKDKLQKRGRWNMIWFIAFLLSLLVNVIQFKTR